MEGAVVERLAAAGVDTIKELRTRQAANLVAQMAVVNQSQHLSGATPMENTVREWIDGASNMVPLISY